MMIRWLSALVLSLAFLPASADAISVFQDPNGLGQTGAPPVAIPVGTQVPIQLFYDNGSAPGGGVPCNTGTGDHVCGWDVWIATSSPDVTIDDFTPVGDTVWAISGGVLRANGGDFANGTLGPQPLGTLLVSATGAGNVDVSGNQYVTAGLSTDVILAGGQPLAQAVLCPDADGDTFCDADDLCPFHFGLTNDPVTDDTDGNGRGNDCECGDQDGDGTVNLNDIFAINAVILAGGAGASPICDANDDAACNLNDIFAVNGKIVSGVQTLTCSRHPTP